MWSCEGKRAAARPHKHRQHKTKTVELGDVDVICTGSEQTPNVVPVSGVTLFLPGDRWRMAYSEVSQKEPAKRLNVGGGAGKEESFGFTHCVTGYSREQKRKKNLSQIKKKKCELKGTF